VQPTQSETAFVKLTGVDLDLVLAEQHERVVAQDSTVSFDGMKLQLPPTKDRAHYVRCPVVVHRLADRSLAVTYLGRLLARFSAQGELLKTKATRRKAA